MTHIIAPTALAALGLSGAPFHEPFGADGKASFVAITKRSNRDLAAVTAAALGGVCNAACGVAGVTGIR